ncbi:MAG: hypothetical protein ACKPB3_01750, partial [Bacteroidota bacterium]
MSNQANLSVCELCATLVVSSNKHIHRILFLKVEQIYTGCLAQGAAFLANPQRGKKKIKLKAPAVARAYEADDNAD